MIVLKTQCARATLLLTVLQVASSVPTYQWRDGNIAEELTCQQCPPGTSVAKHCTSQSETLCQPCPDLHYTQYWNYLDKCRYCNVFCGAQEQVKHECNATHNRVCQCQPGYHRGFQFCVRHKECGPGFGVSQPGTEDTDTECTRCPPGTFSAQSSSLQRCGPHRDCAKLGLEINVPGTPYHDTLCTKCLGFNYTQMCDQDVLDFVMYQKLSPCRVQRLQQTLMGSKNLNRDVKTQRKLQALLTHLKNVQPERPLLPRLLRVLKKAKLTNLEQKVKQRFLRSPEPSSRSAEHERSAGTALDDDSSAFKPSNSMSTHRTV